MTSNRDLEAARISLCSGARLHVCCCDTMPFAEPVQPITSRPVLVTGISGFIGLHVVATLLSRGYSVRGSVRSLHRVDRLRSSLMREGLAPERLDVVRLDLTRDDGFSEALEGVDYAIHIASPVPSRPPRDEDDLVVPARDGAIRLLRAASRGGVRRVVMTSSISAMYAGHRRDGAHVFDEDDWSRLDARLTAYDRSKTVAELAAWEFVRDLANPLELVTVNPGFVLGPILENDPGVTNEVILKMMLRQFPGLPDLNLAPVDVRDVAELHYRAMVTPEAAGHRICCALPNLHVSEIATILERAGYDVRTFRLPHWAVRLAAKFDGKIALIEGDLGKRADFDATRAKTMLGWTPRSIESTVIDAVASFEREGLVPARKSAVGQPGPSPIAMR